MAVLLKQAGTKSRCSEASAFTRPESSRNVSGTRGFVLMVVQEILSPCPPPGSVMFFRKAARKPADSKRPCDIWQCFKKAINLFGLSAKNYAI